MHTGARRFHQRLSRDACNNSGYLCLLHKGGNEQHLWHLLACAVVFFFPSVHPSRMSSSRWEVFCWQGAFAPQAAIAVQALCCWCCASAGGACGRDGARGVFAPLLGQVDGAAAAGKALHGTHCPQTSPLVPPWPASPYKQKQPSKRANGSIHGCTTAIQVVWCENDWPNVLRCTSAELCPDA